VLLFTNSECECGFTTKHLLFYRQLLLDSCSWWRAECFWYDV